MSYRGLSRVAQYLTKNRRVTFVVLLTLSPLVFLTFQFLDLYVTRDRFGISDITLLSTLSVTAFSVGLVSGPYVLVALLSTLKRRVAAWMGYLLILAVFVTSGFDDYRLTVSGVVDDQGRIRSILVHEILTCLFYSLEGVLLVAILLLIATIDLSRNCTSNRTDRILRAVQYALTSAWIVLFASLHGPSVAVLIASLPAAILLATLIAADRERQKEKANRVGDI